MSAILEPKTPEEAYKDILPVIPQPTLFGEVPDNSIETISLGSESVDIHSAVVETKNRINSTNQNRISNDNHVAVINIDADRK